MITTHNYLATIGEAQETAIIIVNISDYVEEIFLLETYYVNEIGKGCA